ncbi:MAG: hypothetical protein P8J37_04895 [Fuerstiella sp.]|nr:hypothetical protein [Fuerstiella sp.]
MGRYWIRNRGKTQGPLSADKIHGLLRRGRFNRHYQVSEDRKNWYVATDFPELFPEAPRGRGSRGGGGDDYDDDYDGGGGGSLFDDDYESESAPPKRGGGKRRSRDDDAARSSPFDNNEDDDDYDDEIDDRDDDDDDDDWDNEGAVYRLIGWVERQWKGIVVLLVTVMIGLGWFVFFRETFVQDQKDLGLLMELHGQITTTHSGGVASNEWSRLTDDTTLKLKEMVERLSDPSQASARDHVKQELLFAARDDFRRMFDELPKGQDAAAQRMMGRFRKIEAMITAKTRQSEDKIAPPPVPAPTPPPPAESSETDTETGAASETPSGIGASPQPDNTAPPVGANPALPGSGPPKSQ